jgi:hypothetical protein
MNAAQRAGGLITENEDGSATYAMSPLTSELLKLRFEIFRFKFGREPRENDPVFFDFNADTPQPQGTDDADGDKMIATIRAPSRWASIWIALWSTPSGARSLMPTKTGGSLESPRPTSRSTDLNTAHARAVAWRRPAR